MICGKSKEEDYRNRLLIYMFNNTWILKRKKKKERKKENCITSETLVYNLKLKKMSISKPDPLRVCHECKHVKSMDLNDVWQGYGEVVPL